MSHGSESSQHGIVTNRTMNMVVAFALMFVATVVMVSSYRLGAGWAKHVGPDSGYFPFYIGLFLFISSTATFTQHLIAPRRTGGSFIGLSEFKMVLQVLIPMSIFVVLAIYIGIYVSTFLFIAFFMTWHGRYALYKTIPVAILVPILLFFVFEVWFLVPLPKGPLEAWLGY